MKFTKEEDYAILFISFLKKHPNSYTSLKKFTNTYNLSLYFLKSIAQKLKNASLVKAKEGRYGGYKLKNNNITIGQIIKAVSNSDTLIPCHDNCPCLDICAAKTVWKEIEEKLNKYLFKISV